MAAMGRQLKQSVKVFHSLMLYRRLPESTKMLNYFIFLALVSLGGCGSVFFVNDQHNPATSEAQLIDGFISFMIKVQLDMGK